jgi:hypothetical protein
MSLGLSELWSSRASWRGASDIILFRFAAGSRKSRGLATAKARIGSQAKGLHNAGRSHLFRLDASLLREAKGLD